MWRSLLGYKPNIDGGCPPRAIQKVKSETTHWNHFCVVYHEGNYFARDFLNIFSVSQPANKGWVFHAGDLLTLNEDPSDSAIKTVNPGLIFFAIFGLFLLAKGFSFLRRLAWYVSLTINWHLTLLLLLCLFFSTQIFSESSSLSFFT